MEAQLALASGDLATPRQANQTRQAGVHQDSEYAHLSCAAFWCEDQFSLGAVTSTHPTYYHEAPATTLEPHTDMDQGWSVQKTATSHCFSLLTLAGWLGLPGLALASCANPRRRTPRWP